MCTYVLHIHAYLRLLHFVLVFAALHGMHTRYSDIVYQGLGGANPSPHEATYFQAFLDGGYCDNNMFND